MDDRGALTLVMLGVLLAIILGVTGHCDSEPGRGCTPYVDCIDTGVDP